jgi:hypothetical protein
MKKSNLQLLIFIAIAIANAAILMCFMGMVLVFCCGNPELWSQEEKKIFISCGILFLFLSIGSALLLYHGQD